MRLLVGLYRVSINVNQMVAGSLLEPIYTNVSCWAADAATDVATNALCKLDCYDKVLHQA